MDAQSAVQLMGLLERRCPGLVAGRAGLVIYEHSHLVRVLQQLVEAAGRISLSALGNEVQVEPKRVRELIEKHLSGLVLVIEGTAGEEALSSQYIGETIYRRIEDLIEARGAGGIATNALAAQLSLPLDFVQDILARKSLRRTSQRGSTLINTKHLEQLSENLIAHCDAAEDSLEASALASRFGADTNEVLDVISSSVQAGLLQGELSGNKVYLSRTYIDRRADSAKDLIAATSSMQGFVMFSAAYKNLAVTLSKISSDLIFLASGPRTGVFEINLPALQPGSSIMPGKVNPVMPELMNQICYKVMGNDVTVRMIFKNTVSISKLTICCGN